MLTKEKHLSVDRLKHSLRIDGCALRGGEEGGAVIGESVTGNRSGKEEKKKIHQPCRTYRECRVKTDYDGDYDGDGGEEGRNIQ